MIKILIADDHAIVREGLKQILAEEENLKVCGEAENIEQLFNLIEKDKWDLIILDINMPGKSGLDALKSLKKLYPKLPVLILSIYSEEQYGIRAFKAGADGYLKKTSVPKELINAIKKIVSGGKYINPSLAEKIAFTLDNRSNLQMHELLSEREFQIMCKIALGESAEKIGNDLSISIHTVYSYRNRIFEKMSFKSNVELTKYVLQNNLIDQ